MTSGLDPSTLASLLQQDADLVPNGRASVRAAVAPLQGEARVSASQTSQLVAGHVVQLLEQQGDWWRIRGADQYEGWMHRGYLERATGSEETRRVSLGVIVRAPDGQRRLLPVNARIPAGAEVMQGEAVEADSMAERFPAVGRRVVDSATKYFSGASYLWGGVTEWGCDCSGLVQAVLALHGRVIPRDAWQQALVGDALPLPRLDAARATETLESGDLLYFSDRADKRITHVGMALGDNRMVHSALRRGGVHVERLDSDEPYVGTLLANFVGARRVLD